MLLLFLFFFKLLAVQRGMWDLSSPTRDLTHAPELEAQSLNHWTTREVPFQNFFFFLDTVLIEVNGHDTQRDYYHVNPCQKTITTTKLDVSSLNYFQLSR